MHPTKEILPRTYALIAELLIDDMTQTVCEYLIGDRYNELYDHTMCELGIDELIKDYDIGYICRGGHRELIDRYCIKLFSMPYNARYNTVQQRKEIRQALDCQKQNITKQGFVAHVIRDILT